MALITESCLRAQLVKGIPNPFPVNEEDKLTPAASDFLKSRGISLLRKTKAETSLLHNGSAEELRIPVGVSNRHVHLSEEHVELLFGDGYRLTPFKELSQTGQFAARETVTLAGPKGVLPQVRVLGPSRGASQVEISRTDGYLLGIHPPVRLSGHLQDTPGIALIGPKQMVMLSEGLIVAKNHVHMSVDDAKQFQVEQGDRLILQSTGDRPLLFADVVVRIHGQYSLELHLDTDEANAAQLRTKDYVRVIGCNGQFTHTIRG
ncbi:phosphate propanoyltransferase [Paenibacillus sp. UNC451MF]|uniref:phosphate propanoyltransferase n=1 Tax=Paenibacillus sp. UNC451MF TaxID=1449063 RepID=UPI00048F78CC|nr:phosphate propanoyltransferase [Paenibacillus sp. UNC451MF]